MDNCWKSQQQENRIREKLFRNNFSWKSDRTSASAFRLCRQCWREENSASMGNCRIFQKIEPPSSREAKSWSVSTFRLRVAHNFPVRYGQFRRQALTEENEDNSQQPEQLPTILLNQIMDNCWKSQQQENRIREKLFRNNFSWKSDRTSASAFRLFRQSRREENSASMGYCRIFQKIEPPSLREAKSWSVSTLRLRVAHNFPVRYGQFRRQALTEENEDNSQQSE